MSINQIVIPPIIANCDITKRDYCPPAGYKKIIYTINGNQITFNENKSLLETLQEYDKLVNIDGKNKYYLKYIKYKEKYIKLKNSSLKY